MSIIDKPSDYFNTKLYTGTGATHNITGVGFQPDWVWIKQRGGTTWHNLYDAVRGVTKAIASNDTYQEDTRATGLTAFGSDGFTVGSDSNANGSSNTYASWNWKAGGTASSNTDGSITSSVSANTTSGFSIGTYTANGTTGATIGHGLSQKPNFILVKNRTSGSSNNWAVYHSSTGASNVGTLDNPQTFFSNTTYWNGTEPTSSVFTIGSSGIANTSGNDYVFYCFAEKQGYSKFGSYTGNGSTDGTFVYTGFKPAFVIIKQTNFGNSWRMYDNKRSTFNVVTKELYPNTSDAEATTDKMDFVSNGFKFRTSATNANQSGSPYIYICFAENPLVTSTGVPATAR